MFNKIMLKKVLSLSLISLFLSPGIALAQTKQNISLLLYNGKIFSADEKSMIYEAVAIDGEKIIAVGTSKELPSNYQAARENINGRRDPRLHLRACLRRICRNGKGDYRGQQTRRSGRSFQRSADHSGERDFNDRTRLHDFQREDNLRETVEQASRLVYE